MQIIEINLPDNHEIVFFGDNHEGSALQSKEDFEACIQYIAETPSAYAVHMGDEIEGFVLDDPYYDIAHLEAIKKGEDYNRPLEQMKRIKERLMPIKDKLITILYGNHPYKLWRFGNLTQKLCEELEIPFGTYSCKIHVKDDKGKLMYKIFAMHGAKAITSTSPDPIRKRANMQNILVRHLADKAGDCIIMAKGHNHLRLLVPPERELYLTDDGKRIRGDYTRPELMRGNYLPPHLRWYVGTASFLRMHEIGLESYAERRDYSPPEIGYAVFSIKDKEVIDARFEIFQ